MIEIIGILSGILIVLLWQMKKTKNYPPGPIRHPFLGFLPYIKAQNLHTQLQELSQSYGPVVGLYMGRRPWVIANSYEAIKEVFQNEDLRGISKLASTSYRKKLGTTLGNGNVWQEQRNFALKYFDSIDSESFENIIEGELKKLIHELDNKNKQEGFYIQEMLSIMSMNILWSVIAGTKIRKTISQQKELVKYIDAVFQSGNIFGKVTHNIPLLEEINNADSLKGFNTIEKLIKEAIDDHKHTSKEYEKHDFMGSYLLELKDEEQLKVLCCDIFTSGVYTISSFLSFCILSLCLHPTVRKKAEEEVDNVVDRDKFPSFQDIQKLEYVESIYKEVFRFRCPTLTGLPHVALKDTILQGYSIPKGTTILPNLFTAFNDPSFWENPRTFRPIRFLEKMNKEKHFFSFGEGNGSCLGEALASKVCFLIFVGLLRRYSFNFDPNELLTNIQGTSGMALIPPDFKVIIDKRF